ncbi:hypothetical protein ACHAWF_002940 [Thalassiosira exigua]
MCRRTELTDDCAADGGGPKGEGEGDDSPRAEGPVGRGGDGGASTPPPPLAAEDGAGETSSSDADETDGEVSPSPASPSSPPAASTGRPPLAPSSTTARRRRRGKKDRQAEWTRELSSRAAAATGPTRDKRVIKKKKQSKMASKHGDDAPSGGIDALLPSLIGVVILGVVIMARLGFKGRATVAGIDLGTTNSVVCVQIPGGSGRGGRSMSGTAGGMVGSVECVPDPATGSPVVPSTVSFLDALRHRSFPHRLTKEEREKEWPELVPHPVDVVVGRAAKDRIDGHPHHTIYHAKRIVGREYGHESVEALRGEVDYVVVPRDGDGDRGMKSDAAFKVPYHMPPSSSASDAPAASSALLSPSEIGAYVVHHLRSIARDHLGHDNVRSAVIAVPAKFDRIQRDATVRAFELAGLAVARILEEPVAAALAYGLHKKDDVRHVLVYDFGGGTLDVSLLYVGEGGYVEVLGSDGDEGLGGADFDAGVARWLTKEKGGEAMVQDAAEAVRRIEEGMASADVEADPADVEDHIEEACPKLKEVPLCTTSSLHTMGERMKIALSEHPGEPGATAEGTCHRLPPRKPDEGVPVSAEELCDAIVPTTLSLTLAEYDRAVSDLYDRSVLPVRRLLEDLTLQREEIDEVVMVGGTTRMPQIRELVRVELGKERLNVEIDPDLTVAYGAASVID